jgi:hypothetical protein
MNSFARQFKLIIVASVLVSSSAFALTTSDAEALTQKIVSTKVAELPAISSKLVSKAAAVDRAETAKVAVVAVAKNNPTALAAVISAVLRKSPESTETVVAAALEAAPELVKSIVSAAVFATGNDELVVSVAERVAPDLKSTVRTTVASAKAARALRNAKAIVIDAGNPPPDSQVQTTPEAGVLTTVDAYAGKDPNRPAPTTLPTGG